MQLDMVGASQAFGCTTYLKDISLHIPSGTRVGIIGRSGAGKTTLLRCVAGLMPLTAGEIVFDGSLSHTKLTRALWRQLRRSMGFITQGVTLLSQRTVWQNVELACMSRPGDDSIKIRTILQSLGLADKMHAYPDELSGGQRQRVAIARAMVHQPTLVLCDEFTSALDRNTTEDILQTLRQLHHPHTTFICVTHDLHVVQSFAQYLVVLEGGVILEQGPTVDVLMRPQHAVTRQIVQSTETYPTHVHSFLKDEAILKLSFEEHNAHQPIVAEMMRESGCAVNIIAGSLGTVAGQLHGYLFVSCPPSQTQMLMQYLKDRHVHVVLEGPHDPYT